MKIDKETLALLQVEVRRITVLWLKNIKTIKPHFSTFIGKSSLRLFHMFFIEENNVTSWCCRKFSYRIFQTCSSQMTTSGLSFILGDGVCSLQLRPWYSPHFIGTHLRTCQYYYWKLSTEYSFFGFLLQMSRFVVICGILAMLMVFVGANPVWYDFVDDVPEKSRVKRFSSFSDLGCQGIYNASIFSRVDQICEDCYNIFREPEIHILCR